MDGRKRRGKAESIPSVPRPPTLNSLKREKGAENVVILGVILRMDITDAGSFGVVMMFRSYWSLYQDVKIWIDEIRM